jgi:hypothetical protein
LEINMSDDQRGRIIRCDDLLEADVNGEIVARHIEKGQCYGMNGVASRVWALLADATTPEQICAKLSEEYEVEPETCRADVMALLDDLRKEGLVKPAGQ